MTAANARANRPGFSVPALVTGIAGLACIAGFYLLPFDSPLLWLGAAAGLAAVFLGVLALSKRHPKGPAIAGIIIGSIGALFGIGITVFALIFVGAIPA